jgi:hypothetical protein
MSYLGMELGAFHYLVMNEIYMIFIGICNFPDELHAVTLCQ